MCQPFLASLLGLRKVLYSCSVYAVLSLQSVLLLLRPFYGPLSGTTRVSRYQKRHSPTHRPDRHPVFISIFHTLRSIASSLFILSAWESFCTTSVQVLFGLPLGLEPSTSYSIHFTQSVSSFHNTCQKMCSVWLSPPPVCIGMWGHPRGDTQQSYFCLPSSSGFYGAREYNISTIRLSATPSGLISDHLRHPPFLRRMSSCCKPSNVPWLGTNVKYETVVCICVFSHDWLAY